jgi:hypothetical protein
MGRYTYGIKLRYTEIHAFPKHLFVKHKYLSTIKLSAFKTSYAV